MKLEVIDLSSEAKGVARDNGKAIFIENAYPGEIVEVEILKSKKNFSEARMTEIIRKSEERIESVCPDFYRCNGCQFCDYKYEAQLEFKKEKVKSAFKKFAGLDISPQIVGAEDIFNYRNHIQFSVKDGIIGYIDKKNKSVFRPHNCKIAPKEYKEIINILENEKELERIKLVGIRKNYKGEVMIILVTRDDMPLNLSTCDKLFKISSHIYQNINPNPRLHYGPKSIKLLGDGEFKESILDNEFILSPTSFFQVNRVQAEKLYKIGIENLKPRSDDRVLELYSGIGTITMGYAKDVSRVTTIEYGKKAVDDAIKNAELNRVSNVEFIAGDVAEEIKKLDGFNKILLDPPRSGAGENVISEIIRISPEIISYISCDPATLARDIKLLIESKKYKLEEIKIVDLFCMTHHVESVVLMSRN